MRGDRRGVPLLADASSMRSFRRVAYRSRGDPPERETLRYRRYRTCFLSMHRTEALGSVYTFGLMPLVHDELLWKRLEKIISVTENS